VVEKTGVAICGLLGSFFAGFFFAMKSRSSSSIDKNDKSSFLIWKFRGNDSIFSNYFLLHPQVRE
jgi:hypothetical protein